MSGDEPTLEDFNEQVLDKIPGRLIIYIVITVIVFFQLWLLEQVSTEGQAAELTQPILFGMDVYGFIAVLLAAYLFEPAFSFGLRYRSTRFGKAMAAGSVAAVVLVGIA